MIARRTFLSAALAAGLAPGAVFAQRRGRALSGSLVVVGSTTLQPLIADIARLFEARHEAVRIEVQGGGTGRGMRDALAGKADIGMVSRALKPSEAMVQSFSIARDGVCLIVHRDNPVQALTKAQMRAIFVGRTVNWAALGGRDAPIELIARGAERGSSGFITEFLEIDYADIRAKREVGDNAEVIGAVAAAPSAVAYVSIGEAERRARLGIPIRLLALQGIAATSATVRTGDFPISRPLMLVTRDPPQGLVRAFIEFALSAQVIPVILEHDFVPYAD